jgi:nucleoside-diphosphate-sugar epimerase
MTTSIAVAGATGNLGKRVVKALRDRGAEVRALVRPGTPADKLAPLEQVGAQIVPVDLHDTAALARRLEGTATVVSTLQGLRDVIVGTQGALLDGAVAARVPRFIPSDFSIDFTRMPEGTNRNFDFRLAFGRRLDASGVRATSIWLGGFMDMLLWGMPLLDFKTHRVNHWSTADQPMQFTTMDDTAAFTAAAAMDADAPRSLHVAGDIVTASELAAIGERVTGEPFTTVSLGTVDALKAEIAKRRAADPTPAESPFPVWVQLQYALSMVNGLAVLGPLDNDRYPDVRVTRIADLLSTARARLGAR